VKRHATNGKGATRWHTDVRVVAIFGGLRISPAAGAGVILPCTTSLALKKAPENTTLGFAVSADGFDALMADLRSKGVVFEEYDLPEMGLKTVNGVAEIAGMKSAWFKDSEGNILNLAVM
jgi:hypothetical protein